MSKNILLLYGGGGTKHEVSEVSARYIQECLKKFYPVTLVELSKAGPWINKNTQETVELNFQGELVSFKNKIKIDYVVPCIHGPPGETGDLQSFLEMIKIPYLGSSSESSKICFNKVTTKLWLEVIGIPTTPHVFLSDKNQTAPALIFFQQQKKVFVKASNQGSSVGCYFIEKEAELIPAIQEAFNLSPYVLVEKCIEGRELEVAAFEYEGTLHATHPGEIICPKSNGKKMWYDYEQKYSNNSKTTTLTQAKNLTTDQLARIKDYSLKTFSLLKLSHLARIDFFMDENIYLNEVNTFPGFTPISMFPKMMEAYGVDVSHFLKNCIENS